MFCQLDQYWHSVGWPSSYQHWTNKGPTSDIIGGPMSAQQWLYTQWFYVTDEENYKPAFLLVFFQLTFPALLTCHSAKIITELNIWHVSIRQSIYRAAQFEATCPRGPISALWTPQINALEPPYNAPRYNAISDTTLFFLGYQMIFKKYLWGLVDINGAISLWSLKVVWNWPMSMLFSSLVMIR